MLLYSKLIYAYLNPCTGRLTEVQDSFLPDGWSQLSWTFLVGSGQTKAGWFYPIQLYYSTVQTWNEPPTQGTHPSFSSSDVNMLCRQKISSFVCLGTEWDGGQVHGRKQRERSSAHCIFRSTVNFDLPELFCSYICPCLDPSVWLRDFEKEKYAVQTPSNCEICYFFKKTVKSA
ncbi:hypothetical protein PAHAL_1G354300 [Panicum hallii]|uniref:Uncharacterized protein n=1 Tax=Panicum hallii TaxID=206008 RepID=A0A2T8KX97_9POAL|nr:hypothetical protein PAHAL_1G354300 [Panicum hallii]